MTSTPKTSETVTAIELDAFPDVFYQYDVTPHGNSISISVGMDTTSIEITPSVYEGLVTKLPEPKVIKETISFVMAMNNIGSSSRIGLGTIIIGNTKTIKRTEGLILALHSDPVESIHTFVINESFPDGIVCMTIQNGHVGMLKSFVYTEDDGKTIMKFHPDIVKRAVLLDVSDMWDFRERLKSDELSASTMS